MRPVLFTIPFLPEGWGDIKSYGFMLMIGFLSAIWLACRRATHVKANPDVVLNMGLVALIAGVVGARLYFVLHYWDDQFAHTPNPIMAAMRIDRGGMEFWGGPLLAIPAVMIYLWRAKASIRWYLDIVAPSLMWGLAFGRIGCLLNGCCWGGVCVDPTDPEHKRAGLPWAIRFPYGSPAMTQQYWFRQMTLPKELVYIGPTGESLPLGSGFASGLAIDALNRSPSDLMGPHNELERAQQQLEIMKKMGAEDATLKKQQGVIDAARQNVKNAESDPINKVIRATCQKYNLVPSDLVALASNYPSLPVHPTQPYAMINAFMLSWILGVMFYRRQRHGVVFGWMILLYSVARFLLECIRQDNPLDVANLTLSQSVCVAMFVFGLLYFAVLRRLPVKSPAAAPFEYPEEEPEPRKSDAAGAA